MKYVSQFCVMLCLLNIMHIVKHIYSFDSDFSRNELRFFLEPLPLVFSSNEVYSLCEDLDLVPVACSKDSSIPDPDSLPFICNCLCRVSSLPSVAKSTGEKHIKARRTYIRPQVLVLTSLF